MWTLATSARAWASGRSTSPGVGCDGVNTFVSKAATNPAATISTRAIAATIHHVRGRRVQDRLRPVGARRAAAALPKGSASKISPGPALVPTGGAAAPMPGAIAVEAVAAPTATTPESVSSDTPGARNPAIDAVASRCGMTSGSGAGAGSAAASAPSRAASPAASRRADTSGAAARASTSSSGPSAAWCGNGCPMRAANVPMVVSVTKGTVPVTAS